MVKLLIETKTYVVEDPSRIDNCLVDVVYSATGVLLAMDVRTSSGGRVLPGMAQLAHTVKALADTGVITADEQERYSE
jgi:hypothetical protein